MNQDMVANVAVAQVETSPESLFGSDHLRQSFNAFLKDNSFCLAKIKPITNTGSGRDIEFEVITRKGNIRKVKLHIPPEEHTGIIKASSGLGQSDSPVVLQLLLTLMGAMHHPCYKLEFDTGMNMAITLEKRAAAVIDGEDFHDLIVDLAETANRAEALD